MNALRTLLLLALVLFGAHALSPGELNALSSFLTNFPILAAQSPPWQSNVSLACSSPGFYGITCSNETDAHVLGLYVRHFRFATVGESIAVFFSSYDPYLTYFSDYVV